MARARIVTDSAAELDPEIIEELGITVVPWRIRLGTETVPDEPGLRSPDFFARLAKSKITPGALAPTAEQFREAYAQLAEQTDDVVSLHISSKMGRTVQAALQGRGLFLGRCTINVIDSQFISRALGILVTEAARAAESGVTGNEIVRLVRGLLPRLYLVFFADTMDYLKRNTLYHPPADIAGNAAGFKPLLMLEEGGVTALQRSRSRGTPAERLAEFAAEFPVLEELAVLHGRSSAEWQDFGTQLGEMFPSQNIQEHIYGPVFSSFIGPTAIGMVVFEG